MPTARLAIGLLVAFATSAGAGSAPVALNPAGDAVWVVNPDSDTVARIDPGTGLRVGEFPVGDQPRSVVATAAAVFTTNQLADSISKLDPSGVAIATATLPFGCAPFGITANGAGDELYVACQGPSALVVVGADLTIRRSIPLAWPEARAVALSPDGKVYVTHLVTKEPNNDGRVSEVDPGAGTVSRSFAIAPDFATCETLGSGQGVANLLEAIAIMPAGAPASVANQVWVGGTLHNVLRKGLFQRSRFFQDQAGRELFPFLDFQSNPVGEGDFARRNLYKPASRDIARAVIWKIDLASGESRGRLDIAHGGMISGLAFSPDGGVAYATDQMANGYYAFNTARGVDGNPASLFGPMPAKGLGSANPAAACAIDPNDVTTEDAALLAPQARLVPTGGMNPLDATTLDPVETGLEWTLGTGGMRGVSDGAGTTPIGLAISPDGAQAFVAAYLARKLVIVAATPAGFRCQDSPATSCSTRLDCPANGECMPLVAHVVDSTTADPLPPEILDGKILFSTAARDAAGAAAPVPPWNELRHDGSIQQGEVTNTARGGGFMACTTCHPDFGGTDGRTWDFSQFGSSLRNTMDLRGRAAFAPGACEHDGSVSCTTDASCRIANGGVPSTCRAIDTVVPPNIVAAVDRLNFFNPIGSAHWNGDRDEVEDFEFTFRELLGASDCDGNEHSPETCVGALTIRRFVEDPIDIFIDLSPIPNRHRSARLDHLGDYVYSLTQFVRNPHQPPATAPPADVERGRKLFNDPIVNCFFCHLSDVASRQQFTDKRPNAGYDSQQTPRADLNNPLLTHDVGTANVFDRTNPLRIASDFDGLLGFTLFQNEQNQIPGNRDALRTYVSPVMNDVWNTAPYLHDGSAPTLLQVVRSCETRFGACEVFGKGRNVDEQHGVTHFLSARQLNDLVAFERAPRGPLGAVTAVRGSAFDLKRFRVKFGKRGTTLTLAGSAALADGQAFDVLSEGAVVTIGLPADETMAYVEFAVPASSFVAKKGGARFADRTGSQVHGLRRLAVGVKKGRLVVSAVARGDFALLRNPTTDLTIALEVGADVAGVTRPARTNAKGTFVRIP